MVKTCAIEDCDKPVRSRGWCNNHYARWCRTGHPLGAEAVGRKPLPRATTEKRCAMCGKVKTREAFYVTRTGHLSAYCRPCHNHYTKTRDKERRAAKRAAQPPKPKPETIASNPCSFEGCENNALANVNEQFLCRSHYNQINRGKELTPLRTYETSYIDDDTRRCTGCLKVLPADMFYTRTTGLRQSKCKPCMVDAGRWANLMRAGRYADALDHVETMHSPQKEMYRTKTLDRIKEQGFERSNR